MKLLNIALYFSKDAAKIENNIEDLFLLLEMVRKKAFVGFEAELFTIDSEGRIIGGSDVLLAAARKIGRSFNIKKECATNLIEIATDPYEAVPGTTADLLRYLDFLIKLAEKNGMYLCPLGTYPGSYKPFMRQEKKYVIKSEIFGANRFLIAGRVAGFHCHYTLPKGVYDFDLKILKMLINSAAQEGMIGSYNLMIAADPALTTFLQSSPFYQSVHMGKDSRVLMYRGGKALGHMDGLYAHFQEFGGLPEYAPTGLDIISIIRERYESWKSIILSLGINIRILSLYGSILDTTWNPVKINATGTLEQRGMDMNHPIYLASAGVMIKQVLKEVQFQNLKVVPSHIGISEPFKMEGDLIFVPPISYVRNVLQKEAAIKGLESKDVYNYCRRFLRFARQCTDKEKLKLLAPLTAMIDEEKTVSDEILSQARQDGWKKGEHLENETASRIALKHSVKLAKETEEAIKKFG